MPDNNNGSTQIEIDIPKENVVEEKEQLNANDLKDSGLSKDEIEKAKKFGLIKETNNDRKIEQKQDTAIEPKKEDEPKVKNNGSLPEFTFKTPEQEKAWLDAFGPGTPQRAMYFRQKNERKQRQQAEEERDRIAIKAKALEEELRAIRSSKNSVEVDENGNEIDPEDKPLTRREWRELQEKEKLQMIEEREGIEAEKEKVVQSLQDQEEFAKEVHSDYEETVQLAKDLVQNIDTIFQTKWEKERAVELIKDLQVKVANASKFGIEDYNAAMISYEIGKLHPKYGKKSDDGAIQTPEKVNGDLTPEQKKLERIENNAKRRSSSASVTGASGRRVVSVEDLTLQDLNAMPDHQFREFRKQHRDIVKKLLKNA